MNKIVLVLGILVLGLTGANTALLVHMGGKSKEAAEKVATVAKELEKVQPILANLSEKMNAMPGGKPPMGPDTAKIKLPAEVGGESGVEPKLPPKGNGPPLPPGLPGK